MTPKIIALSMAAISFVGMAQGQTETLNIVEHSSSLLTATLNGASLSVTGGSDRWTIQEPIIGGVVPINGSAAWQEPGETTVNWVISMTGVPIGVSSDDPGANFSKILPYGTPDTADFTIVENGVVLPLTVTFTDLGDTPSQVPDTTSTLELLGLSLVALGALAKARPLIFRPFNG